MIHFTIYVLVCLFSTAKCECCSKFHLHTFAQTSRVHVHHVSHLFDVNKRSGIMQSARVLQHGESKLLAVTTCVDCVLYEIIAK